MKKAESQTEVRRAVTAAATSIRAFEQEMQRLADIEQRLLCRQGVLEENMLKYRNAMNAPECKDAPWASLKSALDTAQGEHNILSKYLGTSCKY